MTHHIYLHSKLVDMIVAVDAAAGSIDMDGRHAWSVLAAADAGDAAAAVADAGDAAAAVDDAGDAADSMQFGLGVWMAAILVHS